MKYILLGNFTVKGSGYSYILERLATELVNQGNEVMILGINYGKQSHNFPFHIVPLQLSWIMEALRVIPDEWEANRVIIACDVNLLHDIVQQFSTRNMKQKLWGFESLFPVESSPIKSTWMKALANYKNRYIISQFGTDLCNASGLPSKHFPIGCDVINIPADKYEARKLLKWESDKTIFLTIAENHERKALPLALQGYVRAKENSHYYIVTNTQNPNGYDINDLLKEYDLLGDVTIIQKGIARETISMMYHASDALIVPSQAEGACLPIYEAASHGVPVICGTWSAMQDVKEEPWTLNIDYDYTYRYPWGNVNRWMASIDDIAAMIMKIKNMTSDERSLLTSSALKFAASRTWEAAAKVIIDDEK